MEEIWKKMIGYETHYEISNTRKVRCIKPIHTFIFSHDGGTLKKHCQNRGPVRVNKFYMVKIYSPTTQKLYNYSIKTLVVKNFGKDVWEEYSNDQLRKRSERIQRRNPAPDQSSDN